MTTETITWRSAADALPDDAETVMIAMPDHSEPGEPVTRGELIDVLQAEPRVVSSRLTDLARQGIVQHMRVHRDVVWSLVESGK